MKEDFVKATNKVLKKIISKNPKSNEYEHEIIILHDEIAAYIEPHFNSLTHEEKQFYRTELIYVSDKTLKRFGALNCKRIVSNNLTDLINQSDLITDADNEGNADESESEVNNVTVTLMAHTFNTENISSNITETETQKTPISNSTNKNDNNESKKMTLTALELLKFAVNKEMFNEEIVCMFLCSLMILNLLFPILMYKSVFQINQIQYISRLKNSVEKFTYSVQ